MKQHIPRCNAEVGLQYRLPFQRSHVVRVFRVQQKAHRFTGG